MRYLSVAILSFVLAVGPSLCSRDCHKKVTIVNNSDQTVISAVLIPGNQGCTLDGNPLAPGESENYFPFTTRTCIENELSSGYRESLLPIYIVDPSQFNEPYEYYHCDSVAANNKVLKHYELTLENLKARSFTVTYP